jgi:hypothetical protein
MKLKAKSEQNERFHFVGNIDKKCSGTMLLLGTIDFHSEVIRFESPPCYRIFRQKDIMGFISVSRRIPGYNLGMKGFHPLSDPYLLCILVKQIIIYMRIIL